MTDQPPPRGPSVPPFAPMESAAAAKRSRTPLVVGIVLALVAAAVIVVLLAGGDDGGGKGAGEVSGALPGDDGAVTREVTLPAGSALVVRGDPDEDLDLAINVFGDEAAFDAGDELSRGVTEALDEGGDEDLDDGVRDALRAFAATGSAEDLEELDEDGVDDELQDELPPAYLLRVDREFDGDDEVLLFLVEEETELTVVFTGYDGSEGDFDAVLGIVDLDVDEGGADGFLDAIAANQELADLLG